MLVPAVTFFLIKVIYQKNLKKSNYAIKIARNRKIQLLDLCYASIIENRVLS